MRKIIAQLLWLVLTIGTAWPQAHPKLAPSPIPQATAPATTQDLVRRITTEISDGVCVHRTAAKIKKNQLRIECCSPISPVFHFSPPVK